jgi:RNA processing factor Prp31
MYDVPSWKQELNRRLEELRRRQAVSRNRSKEQTTRNKPAGGECHDRAA